MSCYPCPQEKLKIVRRALWILADRINERTDIELVFGRGKTPTDLVTESLAQASSEYEREEQKRRKNENNN